MVTHMKTTVEIADPLLEAARRHAAQRGVTLRELIEIGLRRVLEDQGREAQFRLRDASVSGQGLSREFAEGGWERIRDAIYEGHGA